MYWNHYTIDELKDAQFVYICLGNKKIFGRGEIFDCQHPSAHHRGSEFEYKPEKTPIGMASFVHGLKQIIRMKKLKPAKVSKKDVETIATNTVKNFFSAIEQMDENILKYLPAEKLNKIFIESSKLQHLVFEQAIKIKNPKTDERNKSKELYI